MTKNNDDVVVTIGDARSLYESLTQGVHDHYLVDQRIRRLAGKTAFVDRVINESSDYVAAEMLGGRWKDKQADVCRLLRKELGERLADNLIFDAVKGLCQLDKRWRTMPTMLIAQSDELLYIGLVQSFVEHNAKSEVVRHHKRLMNEVYDRLQLAA